MANDSSCGDPSILFSIGSPNAGIAAGIGDVDSGRSQRQISVIVVELGLSMAGRRCAEWRFPTPKQQRTDEIARRMAEVQRQRAGVTDEDAWCASVLSDPGRRPEAVRTLEEIRASELRSNA